ncbi:MAG: DUF4340 domain-containing protein [Anaerolineales bacterium]|nr:DUF4340 domain-containing protein [Anaerolineales bacterium]
MVRRSTWIVLGVFIALLAVFWVVQRSGNGVEEDAEVTPQATAASLLDLDENQIAQVQLSGAEGQVIYEYSQDGNWTLREPARELVDPASAGLAIRQFFTVRVLNTLATPPALSAMGLDTAAYTATLSLKDGSTEQVFVGDVAPTGGSYYVRKQDGSVLVVSKYSLDTFLDLLRNPQYVRPTSTLPAETSPLATGSPAP